MVSVEVSEAVAVVAFRAVVVFRAVVAFRAAVVEALVEVSEVVVAAAIAVYENTIRLKKKSIAKGSIFMHGTGLYSIHVDQDLLVCVALFPILLLDCLVHIITSSAAPRGLTHSRLCCACVPR